MKLRAPLRPVEPQPLTERDVIEIAERLCAEAVKTAMLCAGGGNNRVYKIETQTGPFALKLYGLRDASGRDRLNHEFEGLQFLWTCGIRSIPQPLGIDRQARCALYEWIVGTRVEPLRDQDISEALVFLRDLRVASGKPGAQALPAATEAVLAYADLVAQIEKRLVRLRAVTAQEPELEEFMRSALLPELERVLTRIRSQDLEKPLASERRILSPSDFGFHNALRREDGSLCFIDFEYFGWDDPVKVAADFLFHPGMDLSTSDRLRFIEGVTDLYGDDPAFLQRLDLCFPLYGIRWALIILNEFLPQLWERRAFSGKGGDWEGAKRVQLQKARAKLHDIKTYREGQFNR